MCHMAHAHVKKKIRPEEWPLLRPRCLFASRQLGNWGWARPEGVLTAPGELTSVKALRGLDASDMPSLRGGRAALPAAILSCLLALLGCAHEPAAPPAPAPGAIPAEQSIGSAVMEGRGGFDGAPPPRRRIRMSSEAACHRPGTEALSEDLIVSPDGGLKNAYVHITSGLGDRAFAPPTAPPVIDQAG